MNKILKQILIIAVLIVIALLALKMLWYTLGWLIKSAFVGAILALLIVAYFKLRRR